MNIRVLIVDDSVVVRRLLSDILTKDPALEVVGMAGNGEQALQKVQELEPDVVTLDVDMPVMNGIDALRALRKSHPHVPVIMFSSLGENDNNLILETLSLGASDFVIKPLHAGGLIGAASRVREELIPKIKGLFADKAPETAPNAQAASERPVLRRRAASSKAQVLVIGVSTGGPNALAKLMPALGKRFPVPILIVQHMPPVFTRLLAERLAMLSGLKCQEGADGEILVPGEVYVAPGGLHMAVQKTPKGVRIQLNEDPPENSCRPAVDVLFRTASSVYGQRVLALILTGMGRDGLNGCRAVREAGGQVLAQDEDSSIVWGMPGVVAKAGLADKILPLKELAAEILTRV